MEIEAAEDPSDPIGDLTSLQNCRRLGLLWAFVCKPDLNLTNAVGPSRKRRGRCSKVSKAEEKRLAPGLSLSRRFLWRRPRKLKMPERSGTGLAVISHRKASGN